MDIHKLIERGEVVVEEVIEKCLIYKREVTTGKDKTQMMEKGPCTRINGTKCSAYISPTAKWKLGDCNLATHIIMLEDVDKFKLNPIKASKRK
jgi:hypothetical protein